MTQDFTFARSFDISQEEAFQALAPLFASVIKGVDAQGYSVPYHGKILHQPGRIGVVGPPASGKSTFIDKAIAHFMPDDAVVTEKLVPSHDEQRMVQVWRRWISVQQDKEVRVEDDHACEALAGQPGILLEEMQRSGVSVHEHPPSPESYCDAILRFRYDEQGRRFLDVSAKYAVVQTDAFQNEFLPAVDALSLPPP